MAFKERLGQRAVNFLSFKSWFTALATWQPTMAASEAQVACGETSGLFFLPNREFEIAVQWAIHPGQILGESRRNVFRAVGLVSKQVDVMLLNLKLT